MTWLPLGQPHAVDARTVGATGTFTMPVTFGTATRVNVLSIAPGWIHIYANGVSVVDFGTRTEALTPAAGTPPRTVGREVSANSGSWLTLDTLHTFDRLHVRAGDTVTLRIVASGFASPGWQVVDQPNG